MPVLSAKGSVCVQISLRLVDQDCFDKLPELKILYRIITTTRDSSVRVLGLILTLLCWSFKPKTWPSPFVNTGPDVLDDA